MPRQQVLAIPRDAVRRRRAACCIAPWLSPPCLSLTSPQCRFRPVAALRRPPLRANYL